jgi:hypothetical protein
METNETRKRKYNKIILKEKKFIVAEGHGHPLVYMNIN